MTSSTAAARRRETSWVTDTFGAQITDVGPRWTTLTDPAGLPYCLTIRDPTTGHA